jgi:hypothetical protein
MKHAKIFYGVLIAAASCGAAVWSVCYFATNSAISKQVNATPQANARPVPLLGRANAAAGAGVAARDTEVPIIRRKDKSPGAGGRTEAASKTPDSDEVLNDQKKRISDAFEQMVHDDKRHAFQSPFASAHSVAQNESVDPDWAPVANQKIAEHVAEQVGDEYDVSMVDCRTDICEIRASAKQSDYSQASALDFQDLWGGTNSQDWLAQQGFDDHITVMNNVDGMPMFIVFLSRSGAE